MKRVYCKGRLDIPLEKYVTKSSYRKLLPYRHGELHVNMSHFGAEKVTTLAHDQFYWPHMSSYIDHFLRHRCKYLKKKPPNRRVEATLQPKTTTYPFGMMSIDFLDRRPISEDEQQQIRFSTTLFSPLDFLTRYITTKVESLKIISSNTAAAQQNKAFQDHTLSHSGKWAVCEDE